MKLGSIVGTNIRPECTLGFLLREHARKDFFHFFPACLRLLEPARLLGFLEFCPARYHFIKENTLLKDLNLLC